MTIYLPLPSVLYTFVCFHILISIFYFNLKNSFHYFLQHRSTVIKSISSCLEKSLFLLHIWRIILLGRPFLAGRFFFPHFEYVIPLSSGLLRFCWWPNCGSFADYNLLFPGCFWNSFFIPDFWQLIESCLKEGLFALGK